LSLIFKRCIRIVSCRKYSSFW